MVYIIYEWSSSEIGEQFREHLALTWEIIEERKNKKNGLYNMWSNGTLRCFSRLLYLEGSLSCYLWLQSLSCSLYLFILLGYSSGRDLYICIYIHIYIIYLFIFPLYELAGIQLRGLLIMMEFTCFGTNLVWGMLVRRFLQFMVYRS